MNIKLNNGNLKCDTFYGSFTLNNKGKLLNISVSNHIKSINSKYNFRMATKCKAGFINISEWVSEPHSIISNFKAGTLLNIQVLNDHGDWMNVFTTKSGKWHSIDKAFLDVLTVGDIRSSFPEMGNIIIFPSTSKTWADKAF
jgi:hypothetical protein